MASVEIRVTTSILGDMTFEVDDRLAYRTYPGEREAVAKALERAAERVRAAYEIEPSS